MIRFIRIYGVNLTEEDKQNVLEILLLGDLHCLVEVVREQDGGKKSFD